MEKFSAEAVCDIILLIPKGKVVTFGEIATLIGQPQKYLIIGIIGSYVGTFISHLLNIELLGKGYLTNFVFCVVGRICELLPKDIK